MALIVEDGSIVTDAESYDSVANVEAYLTSRGFTLSGTTDQKEQACRICTEWLDNSYGTRYRGTRKTSGQSLLWPRLSVYDHDGYLVSSTSIPTALRRALAELVYRYRENQDIFDQDVVPGSDVVKVSEQLGPMKSSTEYSGSKSTQRRFPIVEKLLFPITYAAGTIIRA